MKQSLRQPFTSSGELHPKDSDLDSPLKTVASPPNPEVLAKPRRRIFTAEYKLRILKEVDDCTLEGEVGALLRREGLYSSGLSEWRKQRDLGLLAALSPRARGRAAAPSVPAVQELERLKREHERLQNRLRQAEIIIEVQKKVSELLGISRQTVVPD